MDFRARNGSLNRVPWRISRYSSALKLPHHGEFTLESKLGPISSAGSCGYNESASECVSITLLDARSLLSFMLSLLPTT